MHRSRLPRHAGCAAVLAIVGWCALLAACAKTDPLDERVDAGNMNRFNRWQEKHVLPLGKPVVTEFGDAITTIVEQTADYRAPRTPQDFKSPFNPLCQRVHGWTLRRVLLEGYEISTARLRDRLFLAQQDTGTLRIRANNENLDVRRRLAHVEAEIRHLEDLIRHHEARMRELRGSGS